MKRLAALAALCNAACQPPWTVRPIEENRPFQAAAYVDSIWDARVLPAASGAIEIAKWDRRAPALVKGAGRILGRDSDGRLLVDLPPYDGRADLAIATGAAIHGTALRDALPFIQFSQFVNQVDFARVASALDDRAAKLAVPQSPEISFAGAAAIPPEGGLPELVPVTL